MFVMDHFFSLDNAYIYFLIQFINLLFFFIPLRCKNINLLTMTRFYFCNRKKKNLPYDAGASVEPTCLTALFKVKLICQLSRFLSSESKIYEDGYFFSYEVFKINRSNIIQDIRENV